jgi:tRNA A-37 threonylcarbamoyl transferase component Bud32
MAGVDPNVTSLGDRYDLGPVIGQGGMAEVRAAHDRRLDRPVAVKVVRPEIAHQPGVRERFEAEARLAARLIHPNVVAVFDSGEDQGRPYIVMERLPGPTLHERLSDGPLPVQDVRQLAVEVLAALETAHAAGIVHRDIKPANVIAAADRRWKVTDFGIAKALEVPAGDATATGLVMGTPAYVAPERLLGDPATVASDIYSVGVVLYEALTGRRPYPETGRWPAVAVGAPLVPVRELTPEADPALAGAVERALSHDPAQRYWSAAEMAAQIGDPAAATGATGATGPMVAAAGAGAAGMAGAGLSGEGGAETRVIGAGPATDVLPASEAGWGVPAAAPGDTVADAAVPAAAAAGGLGGHFWADHQSPRNHRPHRATRPLLALAGAAILTAILFGVTAGGGHHKPAITVPRTAPTTVAPTSTVATTTTLAPTTTTIAPPPPPKKKGHGGPGAAAGGGDGGGHGD